MKYAWPVWMQLQLNMKQRLFFFLLAYVKSKSVVGRCNLLISARLQLIWRQIFGVTLPLHFLLTVFIHIFPSKNTIRHKQRRRNSPLSQIQGCTDTYSCTARTIPWISGSPSCPSPTKDRSQAHIRAPCLIKEYSSGAALTFFQL